LEDPEQGIYVMQPEQANIGELVSNLYSGLMDRIKQTTPQDMCYYKTLRDSVSMPQRILNKRELLVQVSMDVQE